ncbi:hypothetical protein EYB25_008908 [Talaromyces marneffei]|nr:hypothetical protein EYB25_008908 [Talaromyces marneffei]
MNEQGPILRKSRLGCRDCRRRRVKCDETKPVCSNCRRRYINIQHCDWGPHVPRDTRQPQPEIDAPTSLQLDPSSVTSNPQWRSLELRLMHHYTAVVSSTMPSCNGAPAEAWQHTIPQLGFVSEVVLNPMLALSALHLHAHSPNDAMVGIAMQRFFGRALAHHRYALSDTSLSGSSEQLWLSAVILCHMCWLLEHQKPRPNAAYELPVQAFKLLEGVGIMFIQKNVQGYGWQGDEAFPRIVPDEELPMASRFQLLEIEKDLEGLFREFDVSTMPHAERNIYMEARDYVFYHYRAFYSGEDATTLQRFIAYMAVRCQAGYRDMLQSHDPLAMALMARMLVLLNELDNAWWANGRGEYEVVQQDVRGICQLMPETLRWTMDWPWLYDSYSVYANFLEP